VKLNKFTFLPILVLLIGVFFLGLGIYETATSQTKDYAETVGYYNYSTIAEKEHYDSIKNKHYATTYYLTYQYAVDGEAYYVTTDYTTSLEPSFGEEIKILYDAENPENAVVGGPAKRNNFLMIFGIFFILGSLPFLVVLFGKQSPKIDTMGILMGSIIAVMGYGALAVICGGFSPVTIFNYIDSSFILPMIIPFLMIIAGVFSVIKGIFFYKKQDKK
jgi:hypothetical protein